MPDKIGVRFRPCGKLYYFKVNGDDIRKGDSVVVESSFGVTIGSVVTERLPISDEEKDLKNVLRKTNDKDLEKRKDNEELESESRAFCLERIHARGLPMKLVCTEVTLDRKRIIFYFTAEGRIDFRELVKDLASKFKTRIEMRQIGVRDETKLVGGIGVCGREVCCRTFLTGFAPVSIKMAKKQELVLNTSKLSGLCGRLMCCLAYEAEEEELKRAAIEPEEDIEITDEIEAVVLADEKEKEPVEARKEKDQHQRPKRHRPDHREKPVKEEAASPRQKEEPAGEKPAAESDADKKRRRGRKFHRRRKKKKKSK
ncbi:MAG: stage 0 sporulation protein [Nitrospirota bacterium]|nr:MAG: stage 0 sporulation protein [Nitrospirota bacterium]